ncbi:TIGR02186 family protein [Alphaproteobacteria bacterium]|nr:TIGR02186 family protein [Alphaproteobacteria bacterium]MDC1023431.1 TIGR02186 family protein [Alphaproteobacteria bacterium]
MKLNLSIYILFFSIFLSFNTKAQNQIVADLSQENVEISTDFLGAKILLFGAYDGHKGDDIIVVVTGPKGLVTIQKKEKRLGVWVNTKKVNYINAPKYLSISSNRDIDKILNQKTQKISEIGLNNLNIRIQPGKQVVKERKWREALTRNMLKSKLWSLNENSVSLNKNSLFRSYLFLPSNVTVGKFEVKILHYRNSKLISKEINTINVSKSGISAEIYNIAQNYSTLYGIFAVLLAVFIGWGTNLVFRKV